MKDKIVTDKIEYIIEENDVPIIKKCICGELCHLVLSSLIHKGFLGVCPKCQRHFYFSKTIQIFELNTIMINKINSDSLNEKITRLQEQINKELEEITK